jgi:exopolysaccharide biosynthesis polyprenyl glycosylphosphotransferase
MAPPPIAFEPEPDAKPRTTSSRPPPRPSKPPPSKSPPPITPKAGFTTLKSSPPPVPTGKSAPPPRPASNAPSPFIDTVVAMAPPPLPNIDDAARASGPPPIVPRRRTPPPIATRPAKTTPISPGGSVPPSPNAPAVTIAEPIVKEKDPTAPPIIRIPHGGMLGSSTKMTSPRTGTLICEILLRNGAVTQDVVDKAIALQEERGGQIGRLLVQMGACSEEAIAKALIEQLRLRRDEGQSSDISLAAREQKDVVGLKVLTRPGRTVATLLATDVFSLLLAALLATSVHWFRTYSELQTLDWTAWLVVGPAIGLCILTFLGLELYSPMAKSTPDEIRDITFAASLVHLGASLLSTLGDLPIVKWGVFVRGVWWAGTLVLVPVVRALVRNALSVKPWWGIPVCVLGAAKTGRLVVRTLKAQPRSGLKPVMLLDDDQSKHGTLRASFTNEVMDVYSVNVDAAHFLTESQRAKLSSDLFGDSDDDRTGEPISADHIPVAAPVDGPPTEGAPVSSEKEPFFSPESRRYARSSRASITQDAALFPRGKFAEVDGVPLVGELALAPILASRLKIPYAVLAMPGVDSGTLLQIVERIGGKFTHLLIIPDLFGFATTGVPAKSLGGILSVEVRQQLLLPGPRLAKRIMDIAATVLGLVFVLPFLLLIAALIKIDSKGPVFYTQKRLGRDGSYFRAYKFRTMHGDGEERLKAILDADPELRAEYEVYHKLKKDPRVTRIGRVLRKFSLDEFPQLVNVLKGDMSLVGPRPYIERELTEMGGQEKIILRAPPGMTGMWQVSDRNATSFAQRVLIDVYYVRNWSPWLDIHILAKTFGVVMRGTGS